MKELNDAEMGQRYKNWMELLARYAVLAFNVGKELAGEAYVKRLEEEFYKQGARTAEYYKKLAGVEEAVPDCVGLGKIMDFIDDGFANFWDGHEENSSKAFEKRIRTCPIAKPWSKAPELCTIMTNAIMRGLFETLNPDATLSWKEFLSTGGDSCHYRIEMKKKERSKE